LIYLFIEIEILIPALKLGIRLTRKIIFSKLFPAYISKRTKEFKHHPLLYKKKKEVFMIRSSTLQWIKTTILGLLLVAYIAPPVLTVSQPDEVVSINKTYVSRDGFHPGDSITAAVEVEMIPGWHIHSHDPGDEFLIPTEILLADDPVVQDAEILFPEPIKQKYGYADAELKVYEGQVYFGILLHPVNDLNPGQYKVKGKFSFQTCNDSSCLPPKSIEFEIDFMVVENSVETNAINPEVFSHIIFEKIKDRSKNSTLGE